MAHYIFVIDSALDSEHRPVGTLHAWDAADCEPNDPAHPDCLKTGVAPADVLAANGYGFKGLLPALGSDAGGGHVYAWDAATAAPVAVPAPVAPILIDKATWMLRFARDEYRAIKKLAETDDAVDQWYDALYHAEQIIDLSHPTFQQGVPYLATKFRADGVTRVIDQSRVAALLAP